MSKIVMGAFLECEYVPPDDNVRALYMWLWVLAVVVVNAILSNASFLIMELLIGFQRSAWLVL